MEQKLKDLYALVFLAFFAGIAAGLLMVSVAGYVPSGSCATVTEGECSFEGVKIPLDAGFSGNGTDGHFRIRNLSFDKLWCKGRFSKAGA